MRTKRNKQIAQLLGGFLLLAFLLSRGFAHMEKRTLAQNGAKPTANAPKTAAPSGNDSAATSLFQ